MEAPAQPVTRAPRNRLPASGPDGSVLLCRIGAGLCGFPVRQVIEIMRPVPVEPLAGATPSVLGVSVIRGAPVPVVDAAFLVRGEPGDASRLVTVRLDGAPAEGRDAERVVALAVDAVLGVRGIQSTELNALPPLLSDTQRLKIIAMGVDDAEILVVLDCARAVPESVWAALSGPQAGVGVGR